MSGLLNEASIELSFFLLQTNERNISLSKRASISVQCLQSQVAQTYKNSMKRTTKVNNFPEIEKSNLRTSEQSQSVGWVDVANDVNRMDSF
jgi:hypothetical protein